MNALVETVGRTFIEVTEVWVPDGDRLIWADGDYGQRDEFAAVSGRESFARGEGLPGKAWSEGRPLVLKEFEGSYFKRAEAAKAAGLTSAVAIPVFSGNALKAVVVVLCADDHTRTGALEVWREADGLLMLEDGYYGAAKHFEWVSQHTHFPRGQGLPGGVWAANTPMLMRDLGAGYRFIRSDSAGKAGLTTGLGLPLPTPGDKNYVLTLLSARNTPIARRFEIWDARTATVGGDGEAQLVDGICAREGKLWDEDNPKRITALDGPVGKVLGTGLPVVAHDPSQLPAGYESMVGMPIYRGRELAHVVAWYL
jgi:hypothetical protein